MFVKLLLLIYFCCRTPLIIATNNNSLTVVNQVEDGSVTSEPDSADELNVKIFKATDEWQEVNDEILPKGLHVRINLATGKKEAKLLGEQQDDVDVHSRVTSNYHLASKVPSKSVVFTQSDTEFLKKLNNYNPSNNEKNEKKQNFKNIDEIKEVFENANIQIKSESALLKELLHAYETEKDESIKLKLLTDLEYYVHMIDLGKDFFNLNGFTILMRDLNHTANDELRSEILKVFGSAIQSNVHVKQQLLQTDFLRQLVVMVKENNNLILKKCLFVLSAFLRNFPPGQAQFFNNFSGCDILEHLLNYKQHNIKITLKVVTLLSDLALEVASASSSQRHSYSIIQTDYNSICSKVVQLAKLDMDMSDLSVLAEGLLGLGSCCRRQFLVHIDNIASAKEKLAQHKHSLTLQYLDTLLIQLQSKDEL